MERLARLVAANISAGHNPLVLLEPENGRRDLGGPTIREFYEHWIVDKVPPAVRKSQARDYRRHIQGYVLPKLGHVAVADLKPSDILGLRSELLGKGLSVKYVRNIISASFRAMIGAAIDDGYRTDDPFLPLRRRKWPDDPKAPEPTPFTRDERDKILAWFRDKVYVDHRREMTHPPYYGYVTFLFWTGARPSEASGLQWGDVDLDRGFALVQRSYHLGEYGPPKTKRARRRVELGRDLVAALRGLLPNGDAPDPALPVFRGFDSTPVEPKTFSAHWYRCLRELGLPKRGIYAMKDTFVSLALTAGVNVHWLETQTGVNYVTLRRHYARYMDGEGEDQLAKLEAV